MSENENTNLIIGRDITWNELATKNPSGLLRVKDFNRFAEVNGNTVKAFSETFPYGVLTLDCLEMNSQLTFYITHRLDFLYVVKAYDWCLNPEEQAKTWAERETSFSKIYGPKVSFREMYSRFYRTDKYEVLVGDFGRSRRGFRSFITRLFGPMMPRLYVWVCPEGFLDRIVSERSVLSDDIDRKGLSWEHLIFVADAPLISWEPEI